MEQPILDLECAAYVQFLSRNIAGGALAWCSLANTSDSNYLHSNYREGAASESRDERIRTWAAHSKAPLNPPDPWSILSRDA